MAIKRMKTYIVNTRFKLPDGSTILRKIAENGLTAKSARGKVEAWYRRKGWKNFTIVSVIEK